MRRVLIVAYWFPPDPAVGALRPWGLYRHLLSEGWEPVVLTASRGAEIPNIIRVPHRRPSERLRSVLGLPLTAEGPRLPRFLAVAIRKALSLMAEATAHPDREGGWRISAVAAGSERLLGGSFDAILSTSPPSTAHLVARDLKEGTRLPWVADLRDLWADNYDYEWSELRRWLDRRTEHDVLKSADALVTVSEPLAQRLRSLHRPATYSIPNGFASEEVADAHHALSSRFTITYTGTLYAGKQDPTLLFQALADLMARGELNAANIEVRFYGRNVDAPWLRSAAAAHGLSGNMIVGGRLPRPIALQKQRESQVLLVLDWMDERQPGVCTGKFFEYLAAQRPILSVGRPGGMVDTLLRETGAGRHCADVESIGSFLRESYQEFSRSGRVAYQGDRRAIQSYDHLTMSRQFAEVLDRAASRSRSKA